MNTANDHPLRYALVNELHARPSPRLAVPSTTVYLAIKEPMNAANRDRSLDEVHLIDLAKRMGAPKPDMSAGHYTATFGRYDLTWESHTEFVSYTATSPGLPVRPFDPSAAEIFSEEWQNAAPGKRLAAVIVQVDHLPEDPTAILPTINRWFARDSLTAVWVLDEQAVVASDFRVDPSGWMRFAVFVKPGVGPGRVGRTVQRLLELETYRAMSMLGLGRARELTRQLNSLDPELNALVQGLISPDKSPETTLDQLIGISAKLETMATLHAFRFGATEAYEAIVHDRIAALRESRFLGRQMLNEFMARRYHPAMRTAKSAERRLVAMLDRTERAGDLLRTQVDVQRSAQNQEVMRRMDRRADLQLRLQHTVEGLSVFAISYYAVGLLGYGLAPLIEKLGLEKGVVIGFLTPLVLLAVWLSIRQIKRRIHREH